MAIRSTENWQAGKNVLGCNEYMLKNQLYCDVTFKVGTAGKEVKAHKYVLASRSSVFAAMLYGSLPEANAVIIPDIEPDVFDTLLRFMYFEAKEMNEYSVIGTLYAADKYDVTDLVVICRSFLESNIKEDTVCVIMENAKMFNMADLYSKCKTFIFNCPDTTVFDSPGFLDLGKECLKGIVESDDLPLDETLIYQSLIRWARHHCEKEHLDKSDPKQLRSMLGDLLYEIRFPAMSLEVFWKHVVIDELLLNDEKVQISEQILGRYVKNPIFKTSKRKEYPIIREIFRTSGDSTGCCWQQNGLIDAIDFEVNKHIVLVGILLYGNSDAQYSYDIEVRIISNRDVDLIHFPTRQVKGTEKLIRINFDKPCQIKPNEKYTVWVKLIGRASFRGSYCMRVEHKDYVFKFHSSKYCTNGTDQNNGQMPGLLCNLKRQ